jgi:hypothetical protein
VCACASRCFECAWLSPPQCEPAARFGVQGEGGARDNEDTRLKRKIIADINSDSAKILKCVPPMCILAHKNRLTL